MQFLSDSKAFLLLNVDNLTLWQAHELTTVSKIHLVRKSPVFRNTAVW